MPIAILFIGQWSKSLCYLPDSSLAIKEHLNSIIIQNWGKTNQE